MSRVSLYIARTWIRLLLLCEGSFLSIYLILDVMERSGRFIQSKARIDQVVMYFFYKIPEMIGNATPFAVLLATLLTLGLLSRTSELTALRSCGLSLPRIVRPLLGLGFACSCLLLYNAEFVVPYSSGKMEYIDNIHIKKKQSNVSFKLNNIWYRSENQMLKARIFDPDKLTLKEVDIWELSRSMEPSRRIKAERAVMKNNRWVLENVSIRNFTGAGGVVHVDKMPVDLTLKIDDLQVLGKNADNLSIGKLHSYATNIQKAGYDANRYLTMMHSKISTPFSAFVMVILAIPFAVKTGRSAGVAWGIGVGVTLGFIYFVLNAVIQSYGRSGVLPPFVAAWGANFVFVLAGIWLAMTQKE